MTRFRRTGHHLPGQATPSPARAAATSANRAAHDTALTTWRRRRLLDAGFEPTLATELAADVRRDLHALLQLVDRGCRPELAARILAPGHDEVGP